MFYDCEYKSHSTIAKCDFPFIDNRLLQQCQNKRIIKVIEVAETFFDVLKALLTGILSSLLQVFVVYAGICKDDYGIDEQRST